MKEGRTYPETADSKWEDETKGTVATAELSQIFTSEAKEHCYVDDGLEKMAKD